jgi:hypothetical protein
MPGVVRPGECGHEGRDGVRADRAELAERRCEDEGNRDDEFRSDWVRWFQSDPNPNVDYARKRQRDLDRLHAVAPRGLAQQMARDEWPKRRRIR